MRHVTNDPEHNLCSDASTDMEGTAAPAPIALQTAAQNRALTQAIAAEQRLRETERSLQREAERLLQIVRTATARYQRTTAISSRRTRVPLPLLLARITAQQFDRNRTRQSSRVPRAGPRPQRRAIRAFAAQVRELRRAVAYLGYPLQPA